MTFILIPATEKYWHYRLAAKKYCRYRFPYFFFERISALLVAILQKYCRYNVDISCKTEINKPAWRLLTAVVAGTQQVLHRHISKCRMTDDHVKRLLCFVYAAMRAKISRFIKRLMPLPVSLCVQSE